MQILLRWAISAGALYGTVFILSQFRLAEFRSPAWQNWFVAVAIMALVNAFIRPILRFFTAPLNCLTFGLLGVLINALMFWLVPVIAGAAGMPVFEVSFPGAIIGSILVGLISGLAGKILIHEREE
jgi:putative membrane protein